MKRTRRIALTGTPGTGKTEVAKALPASQNVSEVADLAMRLGVGRRIRDGVEVDLRRLSRRLGRGVVPGTPGVLVGHLAHLLPIRDAIVLRCNPVELARRLRKDPHRTASDIRANVEAEATDVVLIEALAMHRRIWEVDTTGRSVDAVARTVAAIVRARRPSHAPTVDWLSDPSVTNYLLRHAR